MFVIGLAAAAGTTVTACGSAGDSGAVRSGGPPQVVKATLDQAMERSPVARPGAAPLASDDDHIWMSDFKDLATYSVKDETWTTVAFPWPEASLDSLILGTSGGELLGVANLCDGDCDAIAPDGGAPVRGTAFTLTHGEVSTLGTTPVIDGLHNWGWISSGGTTLQAFYSTGATGGLVFDVSQHGTKSEPLSASLAELCPTGDGYAALEVVDADQPGAVPWGPLPEGWKPDPHDAQRFVTGAATDTLEPVALPDAAQPVLADWTELGTMCIPGGLAIVGQHAAWEYVRGTWTKRQAAMTDGITNENAHAPRHLGDGSLVGQVDSGVLHRSIDGTWTTTNNDTIQVGVGDRTLTYVRPKPPSYNVGEAPAPDSIAGH
ncbi:hypothetical protein [Aquihabitans sp. McL0605]|uniref:hypothetical protein n=1 Tax=Aquihabitans sp. McL0605 TaxID=3415671 RepID=UPI003CF10D11